MSVQISEAVLDLHKRLTIVDVLGALRLEDRYIQSVQNGGVTGITLTLAADVHMFYEAFNAVVDWNRGIRRFAHKVTLATSAADIRKAKEAGKIAVIYAFQNAQPFENELGYIEAFRKLGVTMSQLTYNHRNFVGDGCLEPNDAGLSAFGEEVIREMNRVGMLVDLSHASVKTALDALRVSKSPVIFSHANVRGVYPSTRNLPDEVLEALKKNGGVIAPTMLHVSADDEPTLEQYVDHIDYCVKFLGIDHVAFSTDYLKKDPRHYEQAFIDEEGYLTIGNDGTFKKTRYPWKGALGRARSWPWFIYPRGVKTYDEIPNLTAELLRRGYSETDVQKIMGENFLRLYREVVG